MNAKTSSVIANICKVLNLSPMICLQSSISMGAVGDEVIVVVVKGVVGTS